MSSFLAGMMFGSGSLIVIEIVLFVLWKRGKLEKFGFKYPTVK